MWTIGEGENPRFRGRLACSSAEKMLESYFKVMSDDELFEIQAELDVSTAYYAYYLELLHEEQASIETELSQRFNSSTQRIGLFRFFYPEVDPKGWKARHSAA